MQFTRQSESAQCDLLLLSLVMQIVSIPENVLHAQEKLLVVNPALRLSAEEALEHPWLQATLGPHPVIANWPSSGPAQKLIDCSSPLIQCKEIC